MRKTDIRRSHLDRLPPGKILITIRRDEDVVAWFREKACAKGGGNYQTLINRALREHVINQQQPLEEVLRRVLREELGKYH